MIGPGAARGFPGLPELPESRPRRPWRLLARGGHSPCEGIREFGRIPGWQHRSLLRSRSSVLPRSFPSFLPARSQFAVNARDFSEIVRCVRGEAFR